MKLQVAFRDTGHREAGMRTVIAVGMVEFPDGPGAAEELPEGMIGSFVMDMVADARGLRPSLVAELNSYRMPRDRWNGSPFPETSVPGMVTEQVWTVPSYAGACELFLRKSLVEPSAEGMAVMCAAGLVAVKGDLPVDQDSVFQLAMDEDRFFYEGRVGEDVRPEWGKPEMREAMKGQSLAAFLRRPVWGFGEEPVGMPWHMSLGFADEFDRYRKLVLSDERDNWDEKEFSELSTRMRSLGMDNLERDAAFREFSRAMAAKGLLNGSCALPQTRREMDERDRQVRETLAEAMDAAAPAARL